MTTDLYIGLMSGTSVDAVDAVLAAFDDRSRRTEILATHAEDFPPELRDELQQLIAFPDRTSLDQLGRLQTKLTWVYAGAVQRLVEKADVHAGNVTAIGCHGQTIRHRPDAEAPFTLQLGSGAALAAITGITTIDDFRNADIALGGEGAPLVPAFHEWAFSGDCVTAVVNIGGIANITVLDPEKPVSGYDVGPGNTLLDGWCTTHTGKRFDQNGDWARSGTVHPDLLRRLLADAYFQRPPPKSTGREYFHAGWLEAFMVEPGSLPAPDVQATLTELTAATIGAAAQACAAEQVWLCGGGAANGLLTERIAAHIGRASLGSTTDLGIPPDWVEATAFAWLARERLAGRAAGRPSVTGARAAAVLGAVNLPPEA